MKHRWNGLKWAVFPLLVGGGVIVFALENWAPTVALVVLGSPTLELPLAVWLLGACGAGALTTVAIALLLSWTTPRSTSQPSRPSPPPDRTPRTDTRFSSPRSSASRESSRESSRDPERWPEDDSFYSASASPRSAQRPSQRPSQRPAESRPSTTNRQPATASGNSSPPLADWEEFSRPRYDWEDWQSSAPTSTASRPPNEPASEGRRWGWKQTAKTAKDPTVKEVGFESEPVSPSRFDPSLRVSDRPQPRSSYDPDWEQPSPFPEQWERDRSEAADRQRSASLRTDRGEVKPHQEAEPYDADPSSSYSPTPSYARDEAQYGSNEAYGRSDEDDYGAVAYDREGYAARPRNAADYDAAEYPRSAYEDSRYDQAEYSDSRYDQAGYDDARYDRAGYDDARYDRAGYDDYYAARPGEPPDYGASSYDAPPYTEPSYNEPPYNESPGEAGWAASRPGAAAGPESMDGTEQFIMDYGDEAALDAFDETLAANDRGSDRWSPLRRQRDRPRSGSSGQSAAATDTQDDDLDWSDLEDWDDGPNQPPDPSSWGGENDASNDGVSNDGVSDELGHGPDHGPRDSVRTPNAKSDHRPEASDVPVRPIREVQRPPAVAQQSGSVYSYVYRKAETTADGAPEPSPEQSPDEWPDESPDESDNATRG